HVKLSIIRSLSSYKMQRYFGQVQPIYVGNDLEDGLERPVTPRAMEAELVTEAALFGEPPVGREHRGERTDWVAAFRTAVFARGGELVGERTHVHRAAVGERLHGAGEIVGVARVARRGETEHLERILGRERRHRNHFEARGSIAQQPYRPRRVPARENDAVAARGEAIDQIVEHAAQAGKALERPQLEEFVEDERRRFAGPGLRAAEEGERRVEGGPRAGRNLVAHREWRRVHDRAEES